MIPSESHTLTPSTRFRILDMWDSGMDTYDIAEELGLRHESIVYNELSKMGGETLPAPKKRRRSA